MWKLISERLYRAGGLLDSQTSDSQSVESMGSESLYREDGVTSDGPRPESIYHRPSKAAAASPKSAGQTPHSEFPTQTQAQAGTIRDASCELQISETAPDGELRLLRRNVQMLDGKVDAMAKALDFLYDHVRKLTRDRNDLRRRIAELENNARNQVDVRGSLPPLLRC